MNKNHTTRPWMENDDIPQLHTDLQNLRKKSSKTNSADEVSRPEYCHLRNVLKRKITSAKRNFYKRAFSLRNPKEDLKVIPSVLHPSPKPLRASPDELNVHFASTTERVTGGKPEAAEYLWTFINTLPKIVKVVSTFVASNTSKLCTNYI